MQIKLQKVGEQVLHYSAVWYECYDLTALQRFAVVAIGLQRVVGRRVA